MPLILLITILKIIPAHADWGNNIGFQGMRWTSVGTATTTVIKNSSCYLHLITVTGGSAGTIALYASGTTVGAPLVTTWSSTNSPASYLFDINLTSGCTVVTSANTNLVVAWL